MPDEPQYFYADGGQQRGPMGARELQALHLPPHTLIWREGMSDWQPLHSVAELVVTMQDAPQPERTAPAPITPLAYGGYGASGTYPYQTQAPTPGMAVASLVLGCVSLLLCLWYIAIPSAILAIIFGFIARAQIKRGNRSGAGLALAGIILGFVSIGVVLLAIIGIVGFVIAH
jgi:hypothetical protein